MSATAGIWAAIITGIGAATKFIAWYFGPSQEIKRLEEAVEKQSELLRLAQAANDTVAVSLILRELVRLRDKLAAARHSDRK